MPNIVPFDEKVRSLPAVSDAARGRIVFGVDATASRMPTWKTAKVEQAKMFRSVAGVQMQLVYFRGGHANTGVLGHVINDGECKHGRWCTSPESLKRSMDQVECKAGETQIERVLRHLSQENKKHPVAGLMYVGDMCEEREADVFDAARAAGVRCFMFQEGRNIHTREVFTAIADMTGGAYASFGDGLHGPTMGDLMKVVAQYATGRINAPASGAPTYDVPKALPKA